MGNPVRKIGVNTRSMTGKMPTGDAYESALERDFMTLVNFDYRVHLFTPQPIKIHYTSPSGKPTTYTPDGLIEWLKDIDLANRKPLLVEIKYRADLEGQFYELLAKFRAATEFSKEQGWDFEVFTEDRIRIPLLQNIQFLERYKNHFDADQSMKIMDALNSKEKVSLTITELLNLLEKNHWRQAELLTVIWGMIARHEIDCELTETLTMSSEIWNIWNT